MLKRKEILIFLALAVLLAVVNFCFYRTEGFFSWKTFPLQEFSEFLRGSWGPSCFEAEGGLICPSVYLSESFYVKLAIFAFLFWLLVLSVPWWLLKFVVRKIKRNK